MIAGPGYWEQYGKAHLTSTTVFKGSPLNLFPLTHNAVSPKFLVTTECPVPLASVFWLLTVTVYIGNKTFPQLLSVIESKEQSKAIYYILGEGRQ